MMETLQAGKPARLGPMGTAAAPALPSVGEPAANPWPVRDLLALSMKAKAPHPGRHHDVTDDAGLARIITVGRLACDRLDLQDCLYANGNKLSSGRAILAWAGSPDGQRCREIVYIHAAHGQNSEHLLLRGGQMLAGGQSVTRVDLVRHDDAAFWAAPAAANRTP